MLNYIKSNKYNETISYYTEDIDWGECGKYIAPAVGDQTGNEYDIFFEKNETSYLATDVVLHNEYVSREEII